MLTVRPATADDREAIVEVVRAAFGQDDEVDLVRRVWASPDLMPDLELVADEAGTVVGHVLCTRAHVGETPVVAVAPLAVSPARQRSGVGSMLMERVVELASASGEVLIGLLGHPSYYPRFGFRPAREIGVTPPFPMQDDTPFMVLPLGDGPPPAGAFRYSDAVV